MERLTGKTWVLSKVTLNGVDYTDSVKNKIGTFKIIFTDKQASSIGSSNYVYYSSGATIGFEGNINTLHSFFSEDEVLNIIRMSGVSPPVNDVYTILYIKYQSNNYGGNTVLRLDNSYLKLKFSNTLNGGKGDTTITNTFIAN